MTKEAWHDLKINEVIGILERADLKNCSFSLRYCISSLKSLKFNTKEEQTQEYIAIDSMCSLCRGYADIIIPNKVKLCAQCYNEVEKHE
jgi:hypothetical protein